MTENVQVKIIDMPYRVHGATAYFIDTSGELFYTVFLNAHDSCEQHHSSYIHEIEHINNGDFSCMIPLEDLEIARHQSVATPLCAFAE